MKEEVVYMLGVIAVGFVVNYGLRALPFLLFAGKDREVPRSVERFGAFLSPVIIAGLIVYSYSGLQWKTAWPYLAGVITVALQLWKRNPLVSIIAGTVVYMCLVTTGCSTQNVRVPKGSEQELTMRSDGIYMGTTKLDARNIVATLEDADIPKTQAIHIKVAEGDMKNLRNARTLMTLLSRGGYTRSLLVTERHGTSKNKSGTSYGGGAPSSRQEDVLFYVTAHGVRFGLLTPVNPEDVEKTLRSNRIQKDQRIRLCGFERDYKAKEVMDNMLRLEQILRNAGYSNVKRFWIKSSQRQPSPPQPKVK